MMVAPISTAACSKTTVIFLIFIIGSVVSKQYFCSFDDWATDPNCNFNVPTADPDALITWTAVRADRDTWINQNLPRKDATGSPSGSYVYANFTWEDGTASSADITSKTITSSDQIKAIRFYYVLYGTKLAALDLSTKCGSNTKIIWSRNQISNLEPEWIFQQVPLSTSTSLTGCQLVFTAWYFHEAKDFHGVMALDSIETSDVTQNVEPDGKTCTFEYGSCWTSQDTWKSITRQSAKNVGWQLITASENSDIIRQDHTFSSDSGHVMRMKVADDIIQPGCYSGTLLSSFLITDPLQSPIQCLKMSAKWLTRKSQRDKPTTTVQIYVHLYDDQKSTIVATLWSGSLAVVDNTKWTNLQAYLDFTALSQQRRLTLTDAPKYRLVVEGVICNTDTLRLSGIALDDLRYNVDQCRVNGDDDFEKGWPMQQWNSEVSSSEAGNNWLRVPANHSFAYLTPPIDHSFVGRHNNGWLLVSDTSISSFTQLAADFHHVTSPFCLNFWVWTRKEGNNNIKALKITNQIYGSISSQYQVTFHRDANYAETWELVTVAIPANPYAVTQVVIEARGGFAVDDFFLSSSPCQTSRNVVPGNFATKKIKMDQKLFNAEEPLDRCDFESGSSCSSWTVVDMADYDHFEIVNASDAYKSMNGPKFGFAATNNDNPGSYLLLVPKASTNPEPTSMTAFIYSNPFLLTNIKCVTFAYYMFGPATGSLKAYLLRDEAEIMPVWSQHGSQTDSWQLATINLASLAHSEFNENTTLRMIIEAERFASYYYGAIAVDYISATASCSLPLDPFSPCSFEGGDRPDCLPVHNNEASAMEIIQVNTLPMSTGLEDDATVGTEYGHVLFAENVTVPQSAVLRKWFTASCLTISFQRGSPCVQLWFTLQDDTAKELHRQQLILPAGDKADFGDWRQLHVQLPQMLSPAAGISSNYYRYILTGSFIDGGGIGCDAESSFNWIALDDITFSADSCVRPVSCNFGSYCGGFETETLPATNYMPWLSGSETAKLSHVTYPYPDSYAGYALVDQFNARGVDDLSKTAIFSSEWLIGSGKSISIQFAYYISPDEVNNKTGQLMVYLETATSLELLWQLDQGEGAWEFGRATAFVSAPWYRIQFRGSRRGSTGDDASKYVVAVADVKVLDGITGAVYPIRADPSNTEYICSFEGAVDDVYCNFKWSPTYDNTQKVAWAVDMSSGFAYVAFNKNGAGSTYANLESAVISAKEKTSAIRFKYRMYGTSVPTLKLLRKCNGVDHLLWQRAGVTTTEDSWVSQQVRVDPDSVVGCSIAFQALIVDENRKVNGIVAIDQIETSSMWQEQDTDGQYCSFEYDGCSKQWWSTNRKSPSLDLATPISWDRTRAGDDTVIGNDNTLSSPDGYVMRMVTKSSSAAADTYKCSSAGLQSVFTVADIVRRPIQCLQMNARYLVAAAEESSTTAQILVHLVKNGSSDLVATLWAGSLKLKPALNDWSWTKVNARLDLTTLAAELANTFVTPTPMNFVIEGLVCARNSASCVGIAIDDVLYDADTCRMTGDEDFEQVRTPSSSWTNDAGVAQTGYNWLTVVSNSSDQFLKPPSDHTFNGRISGHALVSENDLTAVSQLTIDMHHLTSSFCLNFWTWTQNDADLTRKQLIVKSLGTKQESYTFTFKSGYAVTWELVTVPFSADEFAVDRIVIEAHGGFAIDDVTYGNYPCGVRSSTVMSVTASSARSDIATFKEAANATNVCDFEESTKACEVWTVLPSAPKDNFQAVDATTGFTSLNGPKLDADGGVTGKYLLLVTQPTGTNPEPSSMTAYMYSSQMAASDLSCLTFHYYMFGPATGSLKVYLVKDDVEELPLWTRTGSQADSWLKAELNAEILSIPGTENANTTFRVIIEAERFASYYYGAIAVDNVELSPSSCPSQSDKTASTYSCSYETGVSMDDNCNLFTKVGFSIQQVNELPLNIGLRSDASYGTTLGHVLIANDLANVDASFLLENPSSSSCLTFAYQRGSPCVQLKLEIWDVDETVALSRQVIIPAGDTADFNKWRKVHASLSRIFAYNSNLLKSIKFLASYVDDAEIGCDPNSPFNWIALDDFYFSENSCLRPVSCNFGDYCGHFETDTLPGPNYTPLLFANGKTQLSHIPGPKTDNGNVEPFEYGLADQFSGRGDRDLPRSTIFNTEYLYGGVRVISINFFYLIAPAGTTSGTGLLNVYYESGKTRRLIWQLNQGDGTWQFGRAVAVQLNAQYRITFEVVRRGSASSDDVMVAIDDVTIVEGVFGFVLPTNAQPGNIEPDNTTTAIITTSTPAAPTSTTTVTTTSSQQSTTTGTTVTVPTSSAATTTTPTTTTTKAVETTTSGVTTSTATRRTPPISSSEPTTPAPVFEIFPVLLGDMTVDQVFIGDQIVTWENLTTGDELLTQSVTGAMEAELRIIYWRAGYEFSQLIITKLKSALPSTLWRHRRAATASSIGAEYTVTLADAILSDADLTALQEEANVNVAAAVAELSKEGAFNSTFGSGSVQVIVTSVATIPKPDDYPGLSDGEIAAIVICSIIGFAIIVAAAFFGFRHFQSKKNIPQATPARQAYDPKQYEIGVDNDGYQEAAAANAATKYSSRNSSKRNSSGSSSSSSSSSSSDSSDRGQHSHEMEDFSVRRPNQSSAHKYGNTDVMPGIRTLTAKDESTF